MINAARSYPDRRDGVQLLAVDLDARSHEVRRFDELPSLLRAHDLVVVNDAATLPGSLHGHDAAGHAIEARLLAQRGDHAFVAVLFGEGDWQQRTEDRAEPPSLPVGSVLRFTPPLLAAEPRTTELRAYIAAVDPRSPRLVTLAFELAGSALLSELYRVGRPVQYSYLDHELPLWAVQTTYAARPWAFEMPSAGRPLSWAILLELRRRGVQLASLTHAAGLSSTGDPVLDARLPLPERFEIPESCVRAIRSAREHGGRVIAVGTTVVRALEGSVALWGSLRAGVGETPLRIDPGFVPQVVDGLISGVHVPGESHYELLGAFVDRALLDAAAEHAGLAQFRSHELGDSMLLLPRSRALH